MIRLTSQILRFQIKDAAICERNRGIKLVGIEQNSTYSQLQLRKFILTVSFYLKRSLHFPRSKQKLETTKPPRILQIKLFDSRAKYSSRFQIEDITISEINKQINSVGNYRKPRFRISSAKFLIKQRKIRFSSFSREPNRNAKLIHQGFYMRNRNWRKTNQFDFEFEERKSKGKKMKKWKQTWKREFWKIRF